MSDTTRLENHPDGCQDFPGGHCHVLPMSEPLDPAAIMAGHASMTYGQREHCVKCGPAFDWPCLPFRLAAALAKYRGLLVSVNNAVQRRTEQRDEARAALADRDAKIAAARAALEDCRMTATYLHGISDGTRRGAYLVIEKIHAALDAPS